MTSDQSEIVSALDLIKKAGVDLKDIIPQPSEFTLKANGHTYRLRPVNLDDEVWLSETFGAKIQRIIAETHFAPLVRIAFHQMLDEDKETLLAREATIINEEGEKHVTTIGGYKLLLTMIKGGLEEKDKIVQAVRDTIGLSRPLIEKIEKKSQEMAIAEALNQSTGPEPSISSQANTVGRPAKSKNLRSVSSRGDLSKSQNAGGKSSSSI